MKVSPLDKRVLNKFYAFLGAISVITSIVFLFADIEDKDCLLYTSRLTEIVFSDNNGRNFILRDKQEAKTDE